LHNGILLDDCKGSPLVGVTSITLKTPQRALGLVSTVIVLRLPSDAKEKPPRHRAAQRHGRDLASGFPFGIATMAWSFRSSSYGKVS
jgi:hypothetical protein